MIKTKRDERRNQAERESNIVKRRRGFDTHVFNNLCGKNFSGEKYRIYLQSVAFGDMGFEPGEIGLYHNGILVRTGTIPKL